MLIVGGDAAQDGSTEAVGGLAASVVWVGIRFVASKRKGP